MFFKLLNTEFVEANDDCSLCDEENDYICQECEHFQVKEKYPNASYLGFGEWLEGEE